MLQTDLQALESIAAGGHLPPVSEMPDSRDHQHFWARVKLAGCFAAFWAVQLCSVAVTHNVTEPQG